MTGQFRIQTKFPESKLLSVSWLRNPAVSAIVHHRCKGGQKTRGKPRQYKAIFCGSVVSWPVVPTLQRRPCLLRAFCSSPSKVRRPDTNEVSSFSPRPIQPPRPPTSLRSGNVWLTCPPACPSAWIAVENRHRERLGPAPRRRPQSPRTKPSSATPRTARPAPWPRVGNPLYPSVYCSDAPRRLPALVDPRRAHFNRSWSPSSVGAHVHHRRPESPTIMRHGHLGAVPTTVHTYGARRHPID